MSKKRKKLNKRRRLKAKTKKKEHDILKEI
jgi:hypothetical protein